MKDIELNFKLTLILVGVLSIFYFITRKRGIKFFAVDDLPFSMFSDLPIYFLLGVIFAVLISNPSKGIEEKTIKKKAVNVMLVLDISGSMRAEDFKPNRLQAAKSVLIDFVKNSKNLRIGLVIFAGRAILKCPLTTDKEALINIIKQVDFTDVAVDGTAIGSAILTATKHIRKIKGDKSIILLTDGENNRGYDPYAATVVAVDNKIKIYTIGLGSQKGAPIPFVDPRTGKKVYLRDMFGRLVLTKIDTALLKKIADLSGGKFWLASNNKLLSDIYSILRKKLDAVYEKKVKIRKPYYEPFIASLLLIYILKMIIERLKWV